MTALSRACTAVSLPIRLVSAVLLLAGTAIAGDAMATTYRVVALPLPENSSNSGASGINAAGEVVGSVSIPGIGQTAVAWSPPDYVMRELPSVGATDTVASLINDAGDIIGTAVFPDDPNANVMWKSDGSFIRMAKSPVLGTIMTDINIGGNVVGFTRGPKTSVDRPVFWPVPGRIRFISGVPTGSFASAVNDSGVIVGGPFNTRRPRHGFRWTSSGGLQDLGDLPGGTDFSAANDVNDSGQIVGFGSMDLGQRAVLWDTDGTMRDLGDAPGGSGGNGTRAAHINNSGEVLCGYKTVESNDMLWTADSGMQFIEDLIDPNDPMRDAGSFKFYDLSDDGSIVGYVLLAPNFNKTIPIVLIPQP